MKRSLCVRSALALLGLGLAAAVAPVQATVVPRFDAGKLADQSTDNEGLSSSKTVLIRAMGDSNCPDPRQINCGPRLPE